MFLAVARTESITLSSRYLHLSQSMLSKNIASIEKELGLILFNREKGRLKLTPAGEIMMGELMTASEIVENAIEKAHAQQAEHVRYLRVGIPDSVNPEKYVFPTLENYRGKNKQLVFNIECYQFHDLPVKLVNGEVDVIFTIQFEEPSVKALELEYQCIASFPYTACMTLENPLSSKDTVCIEDLEKQNFTIFSPKLLPNYYEVAVKPLFETSGFKPRIVYHAYSSGAMVMNTKDDSDVFISDGCRRLDSFLNMKQIPIISDHMSGVLMAWRKKSHPVKMAFIKDTLAFWNNRKIV